ncbi:hypothetical protein NUW58_g6318 [Xylaria curta]|uniref:Uncharacterized protein n=1 Tax=Xylaria curta TaxID=42375 RepID=A0ACC1NVY9_9PEZI|nr:hypothetical protein NUW58_g6318 [Xylaria curta]
MFQASDASGPPDASDLAAIARERDLRECFLESELWEFEKALGHGTYGIAVLLRDRDPLRIRRHKRRVVLKRPLETGNNVDDLPREIEALQRLRGHSHIVQILEASENVKYAQPRAGRTTSFLRRAVGAFTNPPQNIIKDLSGLRGPAVILDYIDGGGSLEDLVIKMYDLGARLPNRMLWSFYYCFQVVRACAAMTYRGSGWGKRRARVRKLRLEDTRNKPDDEPHLRLAHGDIACRNVMIGPREPGVPEHRLVPKLVLIDFGMSQYVGTNWGAENMNLTGVAYTMCSLINLDLWDQEKLAVYDDGKQTLAGTIQPPASGVDRLAYLDPDLRRLITLSLSQYTDHNMRYVDRPSLQNMLRRTRIGANKPASAFSDIVAETDESIRQLMQQLFYDT